ncbi:MAG: hypothetical protein ACM3TN_06730 [Alphaproteobacteria bacterium]
MRKSSRSQPFGEPPRTVPLFPSIPVLLYPEVQASGNVTRPRIAHAASALAGFLLNIISPMAAPRQVYAASAPIAAILFTLQATSSLCDFAPIPRIIAPLAVTDRG